MLFRRLAAVLPEDPAFPVVCFLLQAMYVVGDAFRERKSATYVLLVASLTSNNAKLYKLV